MCDTEIDFLGESEVCEKCLPFSVRFLEIKEKLRIAEIDNDNLKDFLRLMLTKITKSEEITTENKETWLKLIEEQNHQTDFNYYLDTETY